MKSAAITVYQAKDLFLNRHSRTKVGCREIMLRLANTPIPPEDALSVQCIIKANTAPWIHKAFLVNLKRGDFKSTATLSKAMESVERRSGFRSTTKIIFIKVIHCVFPGNTALIFYSSIVKRKTLQ